MKKINHNELANLVKIHYEKKIPLFVEGTFGIGKSQVIKETAKEIAKEKKKEFIEWNKISDEEKRDLLDLLGQKVKGKFIFCDIRLSQMDSSDLRGIPSLQGKFIEWKPNLLIRVFSQKEADGIIFFDEMNCAVPLVLNSCMQILHDRAIGEISFSDNILFLGAGNLITDKASIFEMPFPLKDRQSEVELQTPDVDEWQEWALKHEIDSRILLFLKFKPSALYRFETGGTNKATTPRGWERVSNLIKDIESNIEEESNPLMLLLVASAVGEATAIEFMAWLKLERKVNIDEIMKNPEKVKDIKEIDLKYALLSGLTQRYKKDKKTLETLIKISDYLEAEFGILLWRFCYATNKNHFSQVVMQKKYEDKVKKYGIYL